MRLTQLCQLCQSIKAGRDLCKLLIPAQTLRVVEKTAVICFCPKLEAMTTMAASLGYDFVAPALIQSDSS